MAVITATVERRWVAGNRVHVIATFVNVTGDNELIIPGLTRVVRAYVNGPAVGDDVDGTWSYNSATVPQGTPPNVLVQDNEINKGGRLGINGTTLTNAVVYRIHAEGY